MSEMPYRYFSFYIHVGQERSLVVHAERKDAMLVWKLEGTAEDGAVGCLGGGYQIETMIGREHSKLELQSVGRVNLERAKMIIDVFGYFNIECLRD